MTPLAEIIDTFQSVEPRMRLELLLDYARRLPPLPPPYQAQREAGLNRVPECQTPVFLWVEQEADGRMHLIADVAEEAPTVRGFVAILVAALDGAPAQVATQVPQDLLDRLGLSDLLRMNRAVGLAAVVARVRKLAAQPQRQASIA